MAKTQFGNPIFIDMESSYQLTRISLSDQDYTEEYIQNLAFEHPECIPVSEIDKGYEGLIPVCTELRTPAGYADILYVTRNGKLCIVEAKLWRNPEARRKVIGQILDYAKELSAWGYDDLQREVSRALKQTGNVLFELAKAKDSSIDEAEFVDGVTQSLSRGEFLLIILGDGIREGAAGIAEFLETVGKLQFTFGLVEIAVYQLRGDERIIQPRVLAKTIEIGRYIIENKASSGSIEVISGAEEESEVSQSSAKDFYADFWPEWLDALQLDDPSQPIAKPTVRGNVFFSMPSTSCQAWITVWMLRSKNQVGAFLTFDRGNVAQSIYESLEEQKEEIESEFGEKLDWQFEGDGKYSISARKQFIDVRSDEERQAIKNYLGDIVNRMVNVFRPRLAKISKL